VLKIFACDYPKNSEFYADFKPAQKIYEKNDHRKSFLPKTFSNNNGSGQTQIFCTFFGM
jgi:hypothetical protein